MNLRQYVTLLLESLGISRCYRGHDMAVEVVMSVLRNEEVLRSLRRQVFVPLAERSNKRWHCIERDVRTVIRRAWLVNPGKLQRMAAYPLTAAPTVNEFIEIVAVYTLRHAPADVLLEATEHELVEMADVRMDC